MTGNSWGKRQVLSSGQIGLLILGMWFLVGHLQGRTGRVFASGQVQPSEEILIAHFADGPYAVTTQKEYSGPITITVSGIGQASASHYSDAFYIFTDTEGNPIDPWHPTLYYNWVLWINGQHAEYLISDQVVPAYREDHLYTFGLNAPGGNLTFGVGDVGTGDNTGSYVITISERYLVFLPVITNSP